MIDALAQAQRAAIAKTAKDQEAARLAQTPGWSYLSDIDPMTSKATNFASLVSDNQLQFGFPYQGDVRGQITVRKHPQYGVDVYVAITKGQMLCSYSDCSVLVRFDDSKPVRFSGSPPASHDSTTIFLNDANRFISQARKARTVLVQFQAYQEGAQVLEFTAGKPLKWP